MSVFSIRVTDRDGVAVVARGSGAGSESRTSPSVLRRLAVRSCRSRAARSRCSRTSPRTGWLQSPSLRAVAAVVVDELSDRRLLRPPGEVGGTAGVQQSEMMGRGLDAAHNTVEVDGMTVNTMVSDGRYQAYLNPMLAAETSYTMSGHGAETQTGGLRINMIPNEGGDRFGGNVFLGGAPPFIGAPTEADNLNPRLEALGVSRPARVETLYDVNGSFGGPLIRDRLRFFMSARRNAADFGIGYRGALEGEAGQNSLASANGRLTWQVTPRHKLSVMFDKARKRRFGQHGPDVDLGTAGRGATPTGSSPETAATGGTAT